MAQQLMSYGLLSGAFRPKDEICALRSIMRQRGMLLSYQGQHVQHMQKALAQMNVQLANVIADVVGETGQRILRAIVAGERDPMKLAELKHGRIRASKEQIAMSLHGNWREEHLFELTQAVELFDAYSQALQRCDLKLEAMLTRLSRNQDQPGPSKRRRYSKVKNAPKFDVRTYLFRICGVDLTAIDRIDTTTALKVIAEVGPDLSRFKSAKHFASWLGLCPGTKISGGRLLSGTTKRTANRVAQALKMDAISLRASQSALGAYFRRMCARLDKGKAVTAVAHKLARLIYAMLTKGAALSIRDRTTTRSVTVNAYCSTSRERPSHWGWTSFRSKLTRPKNHLNPSATYHWFLESAFLDKVYGLELADQRSWQLSAFLTYALSRRSS